MVEKVFELTANDLLNEVKKMKIAFVVDNDLSIKNVRADAIENLGQAGYAMSGETDEMIYWVKTGEKYLLQAKDLRSFHDFFLHYELAPKGTTLKAWLSQTSGSK